MIPVAPAMARVRAVSGRLYVVNAAYAAVALFVGVFVFLAFWAYTLDATLSVMIGAIYPAFSAIAALIHSIRVIAEGDE